jgi:hypothetical protein
MSKFNFSFHNRLLKSSLELFLAALIGFILPFWVAKIEPTDFLSSLFLPGATAQTLSPEGVAAKVYQEMPELPQENQYIRQETGEVDEDNTLISRIVRYHQYVKARPTIFRLDWKLTLADYLGANEIIPESRYPGYSTLTTNPMKRDVEAVNSLTLNQRQQLVDVLVRIYNPQRATNSSSGSTEENNTSTPSQPSFELPKPGGAELLLPLSNDQ